MGYQRGRYTRRSIVEKAAVCAYCEIDEAMHVDHIVPFSAGGSNRVENFAAACVWCNLKANDKVFSSFADKKRYLRRARRGWDKVASKWEPEELAELGPSLRAYIMESIHLDRQREISRILRKRQTSRKMIAEIILLYPELYDDFPEAHGLLPADFKRRSAESGSL